MSVINYVYILECSDNTLYTGWTTDLKKESLPTIQVRVQNTQRADYL